MPPKRKAITLAQKQALRAQFFSFPNLKPKQEELRHWFESQFGQANSQSTCSEILSKKYEFLDELVGSEEMDNGNTKKRRVENWPDLESALNLWVLLREGKKNHAYLF